MTKSACLAVCALAFMAVSPCGAPAAAGEDPFADYNNCMADGYALLKGGNPADIPKVLARFRTARRMRIYEGEVDYWFALANYARDSYTIAESNAQSAIKKNGDAFPNAYLLLGQTYLVNRKFDDGLEQLRRAEKLYVEELRRQGLTDRHPHKELILTWFNLGRGLYHKVVESKGVTEEQKQRDLMEAGRVLAQAGTRLAAPDAPKDLREVAVEVELYRGHCHYAAGAWMDALYRYEEAYKLDTTHLNPEPAFRIGLAARRAQRPDRAFDAFRYVNDVIDAYNSAQPPGAPKLAPHVEAYLQLGTLCLKDYPNQLPTGRRYLRRFLDYAPLRHPWHDTVTNYLNATAAWDVDATAGR